MDWLQTIDWQNVNIQNGIVICVEFAALLIGFIVLRWLLIGGLGKLANVSSMQRFSGPMNAARRLLSISLVMLLIVGVLGIIAGNGYLWLQGLNLREQGQNFLQSVPPSFWTSLGINLIKVTGLAIVAAIAARYIRRLMANIGERAAKADHIVSNDDSLRSFFKKLASIFVNSTWLLTLYAAARLLGLSAQYSDYVLTALVVYLIIAIGLLFVSMVEVVVTTLDGLSKKYAETRQLQHFYQRFQPLLPLLRRILEYILYAIVATLVLQQLSFIAHLAEYGPAIIKALGLFFIGRVVLSLIGLLIDRGVMKSDEQEANRQRNATLGPLAKSTAAALVYFVVGVMMLGAFGIDVMPIIAGAGVLGIVVGLGAQALINDVLCGLLMIFETSLQVGDYIGVKDTTGTVEAIGLRTSRIRGRDGQLFIIRNGEMGDVINYSRSFSQAVVEVGVDHSSDMTKVWKVLQTVGEELQRDLPEVLEPTKVDGIEDFSGPEIVVRTITRVTPGSHEDVQRQLRMRVKAAFDVAGIEIPFDNRWKLA